MDQAIARVKKTAEPRTNNKRQIRYSTIFIKLYDRLSKGKDGKRIRKQSKNWYIDYKTADGTRKRIRGFKDKQATAQYAGQLEKEAELVQRGLLICSRKTLNVPGLNMCMNR